MASYKARLKRKRNWDELVLNFKFSRLLYWDKIKNKLLPNKLFHDTIIKDIHSALERGEQEVRYYMYGQGIYECLEDDYGFFRNNHPNGGNMKYSEELFLAVSEIVDNEFSKYDDIQFTLKDDFLSSYFSIKTKF